MMRDTWVALSDASLEDTKELIAQAKTKDGTTINVDQIAAMCSVRKGQRQVGDCSFSRIYPTK
jgi:hypothetical protein